MTTDPEGRTDALWWRSLVAALLSIGALLVVLVVVRSLVGSIVGADAGLQAPRWPTGAGLAAAAVSAVPLWRWLHAGVHDLADSYHQPHAVVEALSTPQNSPAGTTARAIARAVNLPWVEVDVGSTGSAGRRPPDAETVEVPVSYQGERFGSIRVAQRRPGTRLTAADLAVLGELARQLALQAVAERAVERIAESRRAIVAAREEERRRIRRDLHDGLAPSLASIQLQLTAVQRGLPQDGPHHHAVEELLDDLRQASADLRRLVYDLRPPLLDELGLDGTLAQLAATFDEPRVSLAFSAERLPAAIEVAVLRIATEAVMNAAKHAHATTVLVTVESTADEVQLVVTDDGVGIAPDTRSGVGLASMRERTEELGGTLTVDSTPGSGTRIVAVIGWTP